MRRGIEKGRGVERYTLQASWKQTRSRLGPRLRLLLQENLGLSLPILYNKFWLTVFFVLRRTPRKGAHWSSLSLHGSHTRSATLRAQVYPREEPAHGIGLCYAWLKRMNSLVVTCVFLFSCLPHLPRTSC